MSTTQQRLDLYLAAEARILTAGLSWRVDIRQRQEAELAQVRKAIAELQAQLIRENGRGRGSLSFRTATFNDRTCRPEGFER